jgi:CRP-like cAMP-binding protein
VADPSLVQALEKQAVAVSCAEERVLFRQGDAPLGLHILKSGNAMLTMASATSDEVLSFQAGAGSLLGLPGLIGNEPFTLTAVAQAGAQVSFLNRESFTALMGSDPMLAFKVLQVLAAEVRSARRAILQQSPPQARRRSRLTSARRA